MKSISKLDNAYANMGNMNETQYKPIIGKIYGTVFKTTYKYCRIDFIGENYCGELKSRNCNYDTYNETMIGYNKINEGFNKLNFYKQGNSNYKMYFWFAFKEGLYVWELTEENYELNGGDSQKRMGGTNNRGYNDYKEHYFIKKELLTKIDDTPVWIDPIVEENTEQKAEQKEKTKKKETFNKTEGVCLLKFKK